MGGYVVTRGYVVTWFAKETFFRFKSKMFSCGDLTDFILFFSSVVREFVPVCALNGVVRGCTVGKDGMKGGLGRPGVMAPVCLHVPTAQPCTCPADARAAHGPYVLNTSFLLWKPRCFASWGCARFCAPGRSRRPAARPPRTRSGPPARPGPLRLCAVLGTAAASGPRTRPAKRSQRVPAFRPVFARSPRACCRML
jgi:hypothetical protein